MGGGGKDVKGDFAQHQNIYLERLYSNIFLAVPELASLRVLYLPRRPH